MNGTQFLGTPEFIAPEMINHVPYNDSVDIWSLGISLFVMLSGQLPFPSYISNQRECIETILSGHLNYQLLIDAGISEDAINLIQSLCKVDPHQRITAKEAITNKWVIKNGNENESKEYKRQHINEILDIFEYLTYFNYDNQKETLKLKNDTTGKCSSK